MLAVVGNRRTVATALFPGVAGAAIAAACLLPSMPEGAPRHLVLGVAGTAAGLVVAAALARRPALAAATLGVLAGAVGIAALAGPVLPGLATLTHHRVTIGDSARAGLNRAVAHEIALRPLAVVRRREPTPAGAHR